VVFGSDFPCSDPGFELLKVLKAPITDLQKEKILFKNAEKLLATAI
jgi:predicted TIM-barrel fold metal-dependent hydrolase